MEPDPRFELALAAIVLKDDPPARLVALSDHSAALVESDGSYVLVYRHISGTDEALAGHLNQVVSGLKAGRLTLVLIGGEGDAQKPILKHVQPLWSLQRKVQVMQITPDGHLWTGPRTPAKSRLARALAAPVDEALAALSFAELRTRLEATVDPAADHRQEIIDFARRLKSVRPLVTWALCGVCGLMFVLAEWWGGSQFVPTMLRLGANAPKLVLAGEYERLAASTFLHAGIAHLMMNGIGLLILGGFIERLLGPHRLLIIYMASGLAGAAASALLSDGAYSVGASGALFGLFGASAVLAYRPRVAIPAPVLAGLRRNIGFILLINLAISLMPRIDLWAHLGGAVAGAALMVSGLLTPAGHGQAKGTGGAAKRPRAIAVGSIALTTLALASLAWAAMQGRPWELTEPPAFVRLDLGSGVSTELPQPIAGRRQEVRAGESVEIVFGDLGLDPLMISVELRPGPDELADPDVFEDQFSQLEQARNAQPIQDAARSGATRRRSFNGVPTLEELFLYPSGLRHWRYSQLRPGLVITITFLVWDDGPAQWKTQHERILQSLTSARALRTRA